jgi:hypothetical protein
MKIQEIDTGKKSYLTGIKAKLTRDEMKKVLGGVGYTQLCGCVQYGGEVWLSSIQVMGCAICYQSFCTCG